MLTVDKPILLFRDICKCIESADLLDKIKLFQNYIWESQPGTGNTELDELLSEAAYDLDYFEPDDAIRLEDPSFYGVDKLREILVDFDTRIKTQFGV